MLCNVLHSSAEQARSAARGDIELVFCRYCTHLYNRVFQPDIVEYQSGYENSLHHSQRYREYAERQAIRLLNTYKLHEQRVIDIGCGKGEFLQLFAGLGNCRGTGFEPAAVPATDAEFDGIQIIADTFSAGYFDNLADLYVSRHVLEHLQDPAHFLTLIHSAIGERNAVVFLEMPDGASILEHCSFWDIIYEHFSYFTPLSLKYLLARTGFRFTDTTTCFAGQFLTVDAFPASSLNTQDVHPPNETEIGTISNLAEHFAVCHRNKYTKINELLKNELRPDSRIILWGAGSKGISLLSQIDDPGRIEYIVDINPAKQGKYIPGTGQQVMPPEFLTGFQPEEVLIVNAIYTQEIQEHLDSLKVSARIHCI